MLTATYRVDLPISWREITNVETWAHCDLRIIESDMAMLSQLSIVPGTGEPLLLIVRPGRRECEDSTGKKKKKRGGSLTSCPKSCLFPNGSGTQLTNLSPLALLDETPVMTKKKKDIIDIINCICFLHLMSNNNFPQDSATWICRSLGEHSLWLEMADSSLSQSHQQQSHHAY